MPKQGWKSLLPGSKWSRGEGKYRIAAYSEFMPPPQLLRLAYGGQELNLFDEKDSFGWPITEYEEAFTLQPGLEMIGRHLVNILVHLGHGRPAHGISKSKLLDNPYWPSELAAHAGKLGHERYLTLMPLALSKTQDDKGRVTWTLFGGSEQGPAAGFWKSFYSAPGKELPATECEAMMRNILSAVHGIPLEKLADLFKAGFRVFVADRVGKSKTESPWPKSNLPRWTKPYQWHKGQSLRGVRFFLTFEPFGVLPAPVQRGYLSGDIHLMPFPGSLVFWGAPPYQRLRTELPLAMQIPLLHALGRHEGPQGIRIPQSGWLHEHHADHPEADESHGPFRNSFKRTHRWGKVHRDQDELAMADGEDQLMHVLFSTSPDDMGLYGKPMARNAQIWSREFELLLDGPNATRAEIRAAFHKLHQGGTFGYRFQYPAMRVGEYQIYWHRPLVAYLDAATAQPALVPQAPTGYLTAYNAVKSDPADAVELWPRLLHRDFHEQAVKLFVNAHDPRPHQTPINIRKLLDTRQLMQTPALPASLARQLLTLPKQESLETWLATFPRRASDSDSGHSLAEELRRIVAPALAPVKKKRGDTSSPYLTYDDTAKRNFEVAYWENIAFLAEGRYLTKNNADVVRDAATHAASRHAHRDLEALGDYILSYYQDVVRKAKMERKALVGDLPFTWQTDFDFAAYGGWVSNQDGNTLERDLIVVIPGRDRSRAVIMGDHYDTAYMADHYEKEQGGTGARLAAAGADDNHSATVALMLGAPIFLELSKQRKLACDIWLIHLTGEEFPADCMGARHLCRGLVEGNLKMRALGGKFHDLSKTRVQGLYVLDMVAHNNDHDRDVFQIAPGTNMESMWLAYQAHLATEAWNSAAPQWNKTAARRNCGRGQRSSSGSKIPDLALHPHLHGEVRPHYDPRSTLYNTDGLIFSDAGVPAVLFMENYDINRTGYHDKHDTMENIDLDYGATVAAITIESVARAATEKPGF